jgi:hypothetical protein
MLDDDLYENPKTELACNSEVSLCVIQKRVVRMKPIKWDGLCNRVDAGNTAYSYMTKELHAI